MALRLLPFPILTGCAITFSALAVAAQENPETGMPPGDPMRGKTVYQKVGLCVNCHGWAGDGKAGSNPMQRSGGANLRESTLDATGLAEVIGCGIPGTQMPYHDSAAYRDDRCYGLVMADFDPGSAPVRGKTFREKQLLDLVAYLLASVIGRGKPTLAECADYYGASAEKACSYLKADQ